MATSLNLKILCTGLIPSESSGSSSVLGWVSLKMSTLADTAVAIKFGMAPWQKEMSDLNMLSESLVDSRGTF